MEGRRTRLVGGGEESVDRVGELGGGPGVDRTRPARGFCLLMSR